MERVTREKAKELVGKVEKRWGGIPSGIDIDKLKDGDYVGRSAGTDYYLATNIETQ